MAQKKILMITAIAIIVLLVGAYALSLKGKPIPRLSASPEKAKAKEVLCDIQVFNPRGVPLVRNGDLVIESADCKAQLVASCGRFGFFSDVGSLRLEATGGVGSATDIKISEGSSQSYSLSWCGSKLTNTFKVKLFDENNNNIQTKEVKLV